MTKISKFLVSTLLIGTLFFSPILPVIGSELDDIYKEQQKIDKKIEETEKNIKRLSNRGKIAWPNCNPLMPVLRKPSMKSRNWKRN